MSRKVLSQEAHIVSMIKPQGSAGATINSDVVSMKDASHATIILTVGAQAGAASFTVAEGDDFTPSNPAAIAYRLAKEEADSGDTLGALAAVANTGSVIAATDNTIYVIEVDSEDLSEGFNHIQLKLADLDSTTYVSAVCILTGLCYQGDETRTQIV